MNADFTVFLIDDDPSVLKSTARLLNHAGYKTKSYSSAKDFLAEHDPSIPGCAIVDFAMPGFNGLKLQAALTEGGSQCPIIFLSGHGTIPATVLAMQAGAVDFLTKPVSQNALKNAIKKAAERDECVRHAQCQRVLLEGRLQRLTPREKEVMLHVIGGEPNKRIATQLGTAEKTIKVHRGRMMAKIGVRSVAELVRLTEAIGIRPTAYEEARP